MICIKASKIFCYGTEIFLWTALSTQIFEIIWQIYFSSSAIRVSISNVSGSNQWRKESVTIIESQEPMEEDNEVRKPKPWDDDIITIKEENQGDVDTDTEQALSSKDKREDILRRLSTSVDSTHENQFLSVPNQPITASSSAETLTDNTITAPSTPTNLHHSGYVLERILFSQSVSRTQYVVLSVRLSVRLPVRSS